MGGRKLPEEERRAAILRAAYAVATREGLAGVTARAVAAEAGVSSGLVFFHFGEKDALLAALLDWVLASTLVAGELPTAALLASMPPDATASERMLAVVRRDLLALRRARARVELFFAYWVLGTHDPVIRQTIRAALARRHRIRGTEELGSALLLGELASAHAALASGRRGPADVIGHAVNVAGGSLIEQSMRRRTAGREDAPKAGPTPM